MGAACTSSTPKTMTPRDQWDLPSRRVPRISHSVQTDLAAAVMRWEKVLSQRVLVVESSLGGVDVNHWHRLFSRAGAYGLCTAAALLSIALVWFFVRETKGKELERM
jgi:hypothetical protein